MDEKNDETQHVNKVVDSSGNILIDLTEDTVEPNSVFPGVTFHDRNGALLVGTGSMPTLFAPVITGGYNQISWVTNSKNGDFGVTTFAKLDNEDISGNSLNITSQEDGKHLVITSRAEKFEDAVVDILVHHMSAQSSLLSISDGKAQTDYGLCLEISDTSILVPQGYETNVGNKYFSYKTTTDSDGEASESLSFSVAALSAERPSTFKLSFVDEDNAVARASVSWTITKNGNIVYTGATEDAELTIPSDVTWTQNDDIEFIVNATISGIGTFAETDWATIREMFRSGNASNYWSNGDTKTVILTNGTTYTIRIADMKQGRYQLADGSGWSNGVFEFVELVKVGSTTTFQMNTTYPNAGGWADSYMRNTNMQTFQNLLPSDMLAAISEVKVLSGTGNSTTSGTSSSNNKLFLPAAFEMFGTASYSIGDSETIGKDGVAFGQFQYYVGKGNSDRIKRTVGTTSANNYWERSPKSGDSYSFIYVRDDGSASTTTTTNSYCAAPCFAI